MTPRTLIVAIVALVLAGATAFFVKGWLNHERASLYASLPKNHREDDSPKVLVARKALPAGLILSAEHLAWRAWPRDGIAKSYIVQGKSKITSRSLYGAVVRRAVGAGEPVTEDRVVKPGERGFMAAVLTPGMRAVTVPVTATSGIAGFVFPGDRVDLILAHNYQTGKGADRQVNRASETLLTDVRVLAVDQKTTSKDGKAIVAKTATIEVTPKQAEIVALSVRLGELSLSLRSLRRKDVTAGEVSDDDRDRPARRGDSYTRDSDVSRLIRRVAAGSGDYVHILRGSKDQDAKVQGVN